MTINQPKTLAPLMACAMGAINGLLVGLIAEPARLRYLNFELSKAAQDYVQSTLTADFVAAYWEPVLPTICVVAFAAVSYLFHRYFFNHPKPLLCVWFILGGIAIGAGSLMSTVSPSLLSFLSILAFVAVSYSVYRLWTSHPDSFVMRWLAVGITSLIVVGVGVQLVGLFSYWPELRRPSLWLFCLFGVIGTNVIFGSVMQFVFDRWRSRSGRAGTHRLRHTE